MGFELKPGQRKFIGFVLTLVVYTTLTIVVIIKIPNLTVDLSGFVLQFATGLTLISGAFFTSNVFEHFAEKKNEK